MNYLSPESEFQLAGFNQGIEAGVLQLTATNQNFDGRSLQINGKSIVSFSTNNYLGFGQDQRVKVAAIEMIQKYGVHSSIPRPFLSFDHFEALEEKLEKVFGLPALLTNTTSSGHFAYLPLIVGKNDAIILDQFVHASVQMTAQYLKGGGVHVEIIRHNNSENLETRIKQLRDKHEKVWYLCDGIYSMHGDGAPMKDIEVLLNAYENFYCYADDAHGMSWIGENGKGFVLHNIKHHEKLHLMTSLNKGFGTFCSAMVFPNKELKQIVHTLGSTIIFSTCSMHATVGAALAVADIHLSTEIYEKQVILEQRIRLFAEMSKNLSLPLANRFYSPIFLVGTGSIDNCAVIAKYLIDNGFMVGIANYPSVPRKNTSMRISLNVSQTLDDIKNITYCLDEIYTKLEKEGKLNREAIAHSFKSRSELIKL
jgi:7-keto-8-aminopelargonate synthetase-like enzyme